MGFFNFNKPSNTTSAQPIVLQLNEESVTVTAAEAEGKTILELFQDHAADLGDIDRVSRFINAGQVVNGSDVVQPGTVYRGAVTSETKGSTLA